MSTQWESLANEHILGIAPYEPGRFFARELPPLCAVLRLVSVPLEAIVVDGYVWLGDDQPGLGAHLHAALDKKTPIIGVAKRPYRGAPAVEVLRGTSARPLYVTAAGIVNDTRFAENFVAYHADRGQGPVRIAADLKALGLPEATIDAALQSGPDWRALAREARIRKFGLEEPATWAQKGKQARFLQYRGFSSDHIRAAIGPDFDPDA